MEREEQIMRHHDQASHQLSQQLQQQHQQYNSRGASTNYQGNSYQVQAAMDINERAYESYKQPQPEQFNDIMRAANYNANQRSYQATSLTQMIQASDDNQINQHSRNPSTSVLNKHITPKILNNSIIMAQQREFGNNSVVGQYAMSRLRKVSKDINVTKERFLDIIVILGLNYNNFVDQKRVVPQVIDSYPSLTDKEFAKKHTYIDSLIWICFPEGYSVQSFEKKKEGQICKMKTFHFIITNSDGDKKYITSILFKRQFLSLLFQKVILPNNGASIQSYAQHSSNYIGYLRELNQSAIMRNSDQYLMQKFEFYLTIFANHLYYQEDIENDIEIEEIRERNTPHSTLTKKRGTNRIIDSFFRFRNTKNYGFTLENYSFELLLQSLKPERIMFLIRCLLLERKIILIKKNFGDIALIMESLVSLLNPLKWNFVFVTYLTPKLIDCLEAPFPFIIGVSRKIWENQCLVRELPDDIIIFDIDNQELLNRVKEELPPLPEPQASVLQRSLKELLDMKERFVEMLQEIAPKSINRDKIDEFYWAYAQLRVKQSFFNFFLLTINNYIGYFKNLDEDGDMSPNKKDKKYYDKLSSVDVFDFDNYVKQYEGINREFMDKFVITQSFNNFIEDTYKNTSPKTPIGFFNTNFEVMLENSFKRLKKEQNKIIDKIFFNLQNPVRFNISHMFKLYKKQILQKNQSLVDGSENPNDDTLQLNQPDMLETMLIKNLDQQKNMQLSLINSINMDLVSDMPGIEYEKISAYKQLKSQRSDMSIERKASYTRTNINDIKTSKHYQDQPSDSKSRNYYQGPGSKTERNIVSGGGIVYNDFLAMADNKKATQEEDTWNQQMGIETKRHLNLGPSIKDKARLNQIKERPMDTQHRVHSENSLIKNIGNEFMNKTVEVGNNTKVHRAPTTIQQLLGNKAKNLRFEESSLPPTNNSKYTSKTHNNSVLSQTNDKIRCTSSPRMIGGKPQLQKNKSNLNNSSLIFSQQSFNKDQVNNVPKPQTKNHQEKMRQQFKQTLQLAQKRSDDRLNFKAKLRHAQSPQNQQSIDLQNTSSIIQANWVNVPQASIDLMNPQKKKMSRNEERKIAKKKGFQGFEQHKSFYSFYSPKDEDLSKLAKMQPNQNKQGASANFSIGDSKDIQFINNNNFNSNYSNEDAVRQLMLHRQSQLNQIKFMKRQQNNMNSELYASDAFGTTINFQNTFIQQKPQLAMSPSITNTDFSVSKKSSKYFHDDDDNSFVMHQSPNLQIQQLITVPMTKNASPINGLDNIDNRLYNYEKLIFFDEQGDQQYFSQGDQNNKKQLEVKLSYPQLEDSYVKIDILSQHDQNSAPKKPEDVTPYALDKYPIDNSNQISQEQESPNVIDKSLNKLSFKTFVNTINNKQNSQQTIKNQCLTTSHRSPNNTNQQKQQQKAQNNSRIGAASVRVKASHVQTFDNTAKISKDIKSSKISNTNNNTLQRKRSTPILSHDKHKLYKQQEQITSELQKQGEQNTKTSHFKQRAIQANKVQKQQTQVFTIDLEMKQKFQMPRKQSDNQYQVQNSEQFEEDGLKNIYKAYNTNDNQVICPAAYNTLSDNATTSLVNSTKEVESKSYKILNKKEVKQNQQEQRRFGEAPGSSRLSKPNQFNMNEVNIKANLSARSSQISSKNSKGSNNNSSIFSKPSQQTNHNIHSNQERISVSNYQTVRPSESTNPLEFFTTSSIYQGQFQPAQQSKDIQKHNIIVVQEGEVQSFQNSAEEKSLNNMIIGNSKTCQTQNVSFINERTKLGMLGQISPKQTFQQANKIMNVNRTHSVEPYSQEMDMIDTHRQEQLPHKPTNNFQSKQQRSPLASSYISSTNYLKALQNSELFNKDKAQKKNSESHLQAQQSSTNQIQLQNLIKKQPTSNAQASKQQHNQHHKLTHDNLTQSIKAKTSSKNSKQLTQQSYYSVKDVSKSTKNLFPTGYYNQYVNDSSNQISDNANKLGVIDKQIDSRKPKLNTLENALTSKSNSSNSQKISPRPIFEKNIVLSVARNFEYPQNKDSSKRNASRSTNQANLTNSGSENDLVLIDLPRQIPAGGFPKQVRSDDNLAVKPAARKSQLITEIDQMMEAKPMNRNKTGNFNSKNGKRHDEEKRPPRTTKVRNCGSINMQNFEQKPFFEIKYELNEPTMALPVNNNLQTVNKIFDSNTVSLDNSNMFANDYQRVQKSGLLTTQAKKRAIRHGLTTCLVFPNKESNDYLKRDLNQDVFCKISSHMGDIDNDPHTPKSNQSPKSIEKNLRKLRMQRGLEQQLSQSYNQETYRQIQVDPQIMDMPLQMSQNQILTSLKQPQQSHQNAKFDNEKVKEKKFEQFAQKWQSKDQVCESEKSQECHLKGYWGSQNEMCSNILNKCPERPSDFIMSDVDLGDVEDKFTSRDLNFGKI